MTQLLKKFFVPCVPPKSTSQQKGVMTLPNGGLRFFKKARVEQDENTILSLLGPHRPPCPFTGPLRVEVIFLWNWRKSEAKGRIASVGAYPIETRPDCSNLIKMVEDGMRTLGFYGDDGQNSLLSIGKYYCSTTGFAISIATAEPLTFAQVEELTGVPQRRATHPDLEIRKNTIPLAKFQQNRIIAPPSGDGQRHDERRSN